ncbi:MAG: Gldg family protein, partial [Pseudomonadales bacterium]|nr:Gldg family protein [Pseudomonadales bacterium]
KNLTGLRAYAKQVDALLTEYELASNGMLKLHRVDPAPFSEEEDRAAAFDLQSVPVNNVGETLYFGLAGKNAFDSQLTIPFFQPDKETFLEYEISKLLQGLIQDEKPRIGLLSSITVREDMNMQTFQSVPAWMLFQQLEQLFSLQNIEPDVSSLEDLDLLILVHPKGLSEETLFTIDQFVMGGGRMLVFVDPYPERDRPASNNPMLPGPQPQASKLNTLLIPWGITLRENVVLGDTKSALSVSTGAGQTVRHLAILGLGSANFSRDDVTVAALENINFASAGILDISDAVETEISLIIESSEFAAPIDTIRLQFLADPSDLQSDFVETGERYPIAVRLSGKAVSAFTEKENAIASTENINVIVIADTDLLTDQLWVQVQNFFGQSIASPWANNGDFVINAVDNLLGSTALIGIRSRGEFTRPFVVVEELQREAEANFLKSADVLQARLAETEQQLSSLESSQGDQAVLSFSHEQEKAIESFQQEKLKIRKELREVRYQLDKDIDSLGSMLKLLNIVLLPILLTLMLLMINYIRSDAR